ncbi:hypothetical protein Avbf_15741 [Armadillidium vulgare]|nr:hypothetical protein Avbf_15741 [Armadillidium vulgare]
MTARVISPFLVVRETDLTCPSGEVWSVLMIPKRHFRRGPSSSIKTTSPMEILVLPETLHDCFRLISDSHCVQNIRRRLLRVHRRPETPVNGIESLKSASNFLRLDIVNSKEVSLKIWRYAQLNRLDVVKSKEVSLKIYREGSFIPSGMGLLSQVEKVFYIKWEVKFYPNCEGAFYPKWEEVFYLKWEVAIYPKWKRVLYLKFEVTLYPKWEGIFYLKWEGTFYSKWKGVIYIKWEAKLYPNCGGEFYPNCEGEFYPK